MQRRGTRYVGKYGDSKEHRQEEWRALNWKSPAKDGNVKTSPALIVKPQLASYTDSLNLWYTSSITKTFPIIVVFKMFSYLKKNSFHCNKE